jgi:hypothetical protein
VLFGEAAMLASAKIAWLEPGESAAFPSARYRVIMVSMAKQTVLAQKGRRGPPPTGINPMVGVRMPPDELARLDAFIADQPKPINRPTAIRKILDAYLKRRSTRR